MAKNILFLFNIPDWAIHNVGRYWSRVLGSSYVFTFAQFGEHEHLSPTDYDCVIWGYSTLGYSRRMRVRSLLKAWNLLKWSSFRNHNFLAVVQDPCEIFPEHANWRNMSPRLRHLWKFNKLGVTSNEMHTLMKQLGYDCSLVNTNSMLPLREAVGVELDRLRIFTRANDYPRKNLKLFKQLQGRHNQQVDRFDAITGLHILAEPDYLQMIDQYNCYICTSWQEGGPIPLMDAMRRGCVILTTPVGQTDDLVKDGVNGFFCTDEEQFSNKIQLLNSQPELLRQMRHNSLLLASQRRDEIVRDQLIEFLS